MIRSLHLRLLLLGSLVGVTLLVWVKVLWFSTPKTQPAKTTAALRITTDRIIAIQSDFLYG